MLCAKTARLFFLLILLPPRSTLFPYTTLFRSLCDRVVQARHSSSDGRSRQRSSGRRGQPGAKRGDRKSTRLNSSHITISYAVFCLKKKTHIEIMPVLDELVRQGAAVLCSVLAI